jgi:hypothetical protein
MNQSVDVEKMRSTFQRQDLARFIIDVREPTEDQGDLTERRLEYKLTPAERYCCDRATD